MATSPKSADRASRVYHMREAGLTLKQIGHLYGISRERVRQIAESYALAQGLSAPERPARAPRLPVCKKCGQAYPNGSYAEHLAEAGHKRPGKDEQYPERTDAIVSDYLAGMRTSEIREKYGVRAPAIYYALRLRGVAKNRGGGKYVRSPEWREAAAARSRGRLGYPEDVVSEVYLARELDGKSFVAIAKKFGIGYGTARAYYKRGLRMYADIDAETPIGPDPAAGSDRDVPATSGPPDRGSPGSRRVRPSQLPEDQGGAPFARGA